MSSFVAITLLLAQAQGELEGVVTHVHDGDTVHVTKADGSVVKVRFVLCDAPEVDQPHGIESRDFVRGMCLEKAVRVVTQGQDDYGRTLGEVFVGGESVNKAVIRNGHGWWFYHYDPDPAIGALEAEARAGMKGLFADEAPIYPRAWRRGARLAEERTSGVTSPVRIMALMPDPGGRDEGNETVTVSNSSTAAVSLDGWRVADSEGEFALSGEVAAGEARAFRLSPAVRLGNDGDTVVLKNAEGVEVQKVTYPGARRGRFVVVP